MLVAYINHQSMDVGGYTKIHLPGFLGRLDSFTKQDNLKMLGYLEIHDIILSSGRGGPGMEGRQRKSHLHRYISLAW
jgi:hypothetical protein